MSYCLNPHCPRPDNYNEAELCKACGSRLRLKERYRALRLIGRGGFGRTFLAIDEDKPSHSRCVVKQFYPPEPKNSGVQKAEELFRQEAVRLEELGKHPQIPELLAYLQQENYQYIVQEYINGQHLAAESKIQKRPHSETQIWHLLKSLLPVLHYIHQHRVIHRDIKPENIIRWRTLPPFSSPTIEDLVLVDFGAAKHATVTALAKPGTVIGSAGYTAPEQAAGKAVFASDIFSLGVTCLHLLTQVDPFDLYSHKEGVWCWQSRLQGNTVSTDLAHILNKMVALTIQDRFKSANSVIKTLTPALLTPRSPSSPIQPLVPTALSSAPLPITGLLPHHELKTFEFEVVLLDGRGHVLGREQGQNLGFVERLASSKGESMELEMVAIPSGTFPMGAAKTDTRATAREKPQHFVTVNPFFMGKHPITQAQWEAVAHLPRVQRDLHPQPAHFQTAYEDCPAADRPVESVSWYDAVEFCDRLAIHTQRPYRLPNEAEWEYACRADTTTPFHFGSSLSAEFANFDSRHSRGGVVKGMYRQETTPTNWFQVANRFGLHDTHGNVWEWCADPWHENYRNAPMDAMVWEEDGNANLRVLRGGSWCDYGKYCRSSFRDGEEPDFRFYGVGFRVAVSESPLGK